MKFSINNIVTDIGTYEVTDAIVSCCWCQTAIRIVCACVWNKDINVIQCNLQQFSVVKVIGFNLVLVIRIVMIVEVHSKASVPG